MLAFHNDPGLRDFILATLAELREADKLDKYHYWEDGSGSAVGCTLEAVRSRRGMGDSFDHSSHALYETELGIPRVLAHLEDKIFERLPYEASQRWPERFISAVHPGADLTMVWPGFAFWLLTEEVPRSTAPLTEPAALYREWIDTGEKPDSARWGKARQDATSAVLDAMRAGYNSAAHGGAYASLAAAICADDAHAMDVYDGDATHCAADAANSAAQAAEFAARPGYRARASEESIQRQADKLIEVIARAHTAKP